MNATAPKTRRDLVAGSAQGLLLLGAAAVSVVVVLSALVALLNFSATTTSGGANTVLLGTTDAGKDSWNTFVAEAKRQGITIDTVNFTNYQQPNDALAQGQLGANLFQHLRFLAEYNVAHNTHLTPVAATFIVPLGLYSHKHKTLAEIPRGGQIAVPNDPSNQGRALFVLRAAGLIRLVGNRLSPTANDVDKAASKVSLVLVDPAQTARSLDSVDGAVVNNNYLSDSGIDPRTALAKDDPNDPNSAQYINVIVVRPEDKDNPLYPKLADIYHSKPVNDAYNTESKGTQVAVTRPAAELQAILADVEAKIRAGQ
ncbi:YaeC family lipoprotein [Segniliparus rugosus ATCC BAA-974]|uniref:YaeC family lipoprotein n=1 Tax=Segniliparus rugosus (strain ATCC BAA-974 / DSM 45345 / CCUG 50838 / CIP 108380 / JCM 13579 / CDC 945) TaxID=679197 RepID=U1N5D2_SEGRC|nr:MetQ/NlpA family ABC transporter substrate-binding protein [Segniliparus rugosus]ERG69359.1 YaeC family lipoprotein [Segniliparus rugosus ATCC BAA-974]